ncbi:MAG: hypothetical protein E7619_04095 [Ruminococcaceae bacterium]|nr:hypothetical protein [Oscillospiraceae bacterium]
MTNIKSTKRALITSAVSLLMCFAMLVGTTAAWFTDSVQTGINTIQAGNLDIELYYAYPSDVENGAIADNKWKRVDANSPVFDPNALWEPGFTQVVYFKAVNEGELSLKYLMNVDIVSETTGLTKTGEIIKLSDHIQAYAQQGQQGLWRPFIDRDEVVDPPYLPAELNGVFSQTLSKAADGYGYGTPSENPYSLDLDQWLEPGEVWYTSLALFMPETVGNEANHNGVNKPSIKLGISLVATQYNWEPEADSFDHNYDANATVIINDVNKLQAAVNAAKDGAIIYIEQGNYELNSMVVIDGKSVSIVGLGEVNIKMKAAQHMFTVQDQYDHESKVVVNISNLNLDGNNVAKHGINVKYNVTANITDVNVKNTNWASILLDNANKYNDGNFYNGTKTVVNLKDSTVETVSMDTLPVVPTHAYAGAGVTTYAYFNHTNSVIGSIEKQAISADASTMYVNGDNGSVGTTVFSKDPAEIATALAGGKSVVLNDDVKTEAATAAPYGNKYGFALNGGVLDGNGNELEIDCYGDDYGIMTTGGTIKNVTIEEGCRAVMIMYPTEDVIIDNAVIGGDGVLYPINTGEAGSAGVDLIVSNSTLKGWTSYSNIESATFTNVKFEQGTYYNNIYGRVLKPYVNTTLTNCSFIEHMNLDLSGLINGQKIVLDNCTVNGVDIVDASVFTIPTTDSQYDTELFTIDLPGWASSIADCVVIK